MQCDVQYTTLSVDCFATTFYAAERDLQMYALYKSTFYLLSYLLTYLDVDWHPSQHSLLRSADMAVWQKRYHQRVW